MSNRKIPLLFIILFACTLWVGEYIRRDLWEPDEARYAYVAREMAHNGNWLVPYRHGEFYAHKPPLMFWMINAGSVLTGGVGNISARLPSLLGAILSLWMISRLMLLWSNSITAWRSFFILSTSYLFWHQGGMGQIDMLLCGLELAAIYLLFKNDDDPAIWRLLLSFSFMGWAVLAKGPVGFIIPTGIYVSVSCFTGNKKLLFKPHWLWGPLLAVLWPVLWLLMIKIKGAPDGYFNELLFAQTIGRATGSFGGHYRPFYYYLKYFPMDFLPWTFFLPVSIVVLHKKNNILFRRLVGWMLFVLIFFSLCAGKRNLYILSIYPAASMFIAASWGRLEELNGKGFKRSVWFLFSILILIATVIAVVPFCVKLPINKFVFIPVSVVFFIGIVILIILFRREGLTSKWFNIFIIMFLLNYFLIGTVVFPAFNPLKTPVALASAATVKLKPEQKLLLYKMNGEIMAFYCKRQGMKIKSSNELFKEMKKMETGIAVFGLREWREVAEKCKLLGEEHYFKMGNKDLVWLEF